MTAGARWGQCGGLETGSSAFRFLSAPRDGSQGFERGVLTWDIGVRP